MTGKPVEGPRPAAPGAGSTDRGPERNSSGSDPPGAEPRDANPRDAEPPDSGPPAVQGATAYAVATETYALKSESQETLHAGIPTRPSSPDPDRHAPPSPASSSTDLPNHSATSEIQADPTDWTHPDYVSIFSDTKDSALGDEFESSTASISRSITDYRLIYGRTYHSIRGSGDANYWMPNDERQNESLDYSHHSHLLLLDGKLHLAPLSADDVDKVLDVGTGTGIWAIDFADANPRSQVIGVDVSPIQPRWVPPNVEFEVDDITQEWTWQAGNFDFIYIRGLIGSIKDWKKLYREAYKCCKPGGWIESSELDLTICSDDGSVRDGMALVALSRCVKEAGRRMGRSSKDDTARQPAHKRGPAEPAADKDPAVEIAEGGFMGEAVRSAGFTDVVVKRFKKPLNCTGPDPKLREIGSYMYASLAEGLEGMALYPLVHVLGWPLVQVQLLLSRIRLELSSSIVRPYVWVQIVYAKKPEST